MTSVQGTYYFPGSAQCCPAYLTLTKGSVELEGGDDVQFTVADTKVQFVSAIPGVKAELQFADGGYFVAADNQFCWPTGAGRKSVLRRLESNKLSVLLAIIAIPMALWGIYHVLLPTMATQIAKAVPTELIEQADQQALRSLQNTVLSPSKLPQVEQTWLRHRFRQLVNHASTETGRYRLYLSASQKLGANALALPAGSVIVTDQLVKQLGAESDELAAVILHEIGHVEQQHGVAMVARSTSVALVLAAVLGDVEVAGDMLIGAGTIMLEQAFSRDMERQADAFANQQLTALPLANDALASALRKMLAEREQTGSWAEYLSTHPPVDERIENASSH